MEDINPIPSVWSPEIPTPTPTKSPTEFKEWVEKELRSFGCGSVYYDIEIAEVAKQVVNGTASDEKISDLQRTIAWRQKKQVEISQLVSLFVQKNVIPEEVSKSPVLILPISNASYHNRKLLTKAVPELSAFVDPPEDDELQTKFLAPLYWLSIVLARAREKSPDSCYLEKVVRTLIEADIAHVPEGRAKEDHVREVTAEGELQAEDLWLGMDSVTEGFSRSKSCFGWTLPPYDVEPPAVEEKKEEGGFSGWDQGSNLDAWTEQEGKGEMASKDRFGFKNLGILVLVICSFIWFIPGLSPQTQSSYERMFGHWIF